MLGEFDDNSCSLLVSPAQLTQTLIRVLLMESTGRYSGRVCLWSQQVDIAGGKDDKTKLFVYLYYTATVMIVGKSVTLVYHIICLITKYIISR
jgi:hypothetical protein